MVFGKYLYCANTKSSRGQEGICGTGTLTGVSIKFPHLLLQGNLHHRTVIQSLYRS